MNIGIFDEEAKNLNPLTNKQYTDEYKKILKTIIKLPAYKHLPHILELIKKNDVIIITSSTGSGKSLFLPKVALHSLNYTGLVAMTLPKKDIARSAAEFGAKTMDVDLETGIIGYKYRDNSLYNKNTKILYMTDGTLINYLQNDISLEGIDVVIMDELHERNTRMDILLYYLKKTLENRKNFKLILMSATMDTSLFKNYYNKSKIGVLNIESERLFKITNVYTQKTLKEYMTSGFEILKKIVNETLDGDIMFFVPSMAETKNLCKMIKMDKSLSKCYCMELYANLNEKQKDFVRDSQAYKTIDPNKKYNRKIIICTNVAESSLTVDGIKFVIDSGFEYKENYDPIYDVRRLDKNLITKAQAIQRCGRSGRTSTGTCYSLYTNEEYENMKKYPEPAIKLVNLSSIFLKFLDKSDKNTLKSAINQFNLFIEQPAEIFVRSAYLQLLNLNLIVEKPEPTITDLGILVKELQIDDPKIGICYVYAQKNRCLREMVFLMEYIEAIKNNILGIFTNVKENENEELVVDDKIKRYVYEKFFIKNSDHLSLLNIIITFSNMKSENRKEQCYKYNLNYGIIEKTLMRGKKMFYKYSDIFKKYSIKSDEINGSKSMNTKIMNSIYEGFKMNNSTLKNNVYPIKDKFKLGDGSEINATVKNSFINLKQLPKNIIYQEAFKSNSGYECNIISEIAIK